MKLKGLLLMMTMLAGGGRTAEEYRDENGVMFVNEAWGLRPGGRVMPVVNWKHPERAPAHLVQTWRVVAYPDGAIRLECTQLFVPKRSDGLCTDYAWTIEDGEDNRTLCGDLGGLSFLSATNEIMITLRTGDQAAAKAECTVQARLMGPDGEVTDPPPSTTPAPPPRPAWPPEFTRIPSEEVDSSEHGGPPGPVPTTCPCGMANKGTSRIIGGQETAVNEFPFMAMLMRMGSTKPFCGGSLITRRHVLTAAHCLYKKEASRIFVGLGDHDYTQETSPYRKRMEVREIVIHEKYEEAKDMDIGLVVLKELADLNRYVGLVCLPSRPLNLTGQYLTIMGWGKIGWKKGEGQSAYLKKVRVRVVPLEQCAPYTAIVTKQPHQICTYGKNKGLSQGDSGSPVVWLDPYTNRYVQAAIPSYVYPYIAEHFRPDVCTALVDFMIRWVLSHINRTDPSQQACYSTQ
uniref:Venom S1 protease 5 n=1 Tax=Lethocerus distinctifemur TaxID=280095 RepID=A0A2K8JL04_9HEMI|nr:venom S1 protease 5 [Lethocerus distinctifemur]